MDENLPPGGAPSIPPSPKPPENTAPNEISSAPAPTSEPLQGTASTPIASSALPPVATPPVVNTPLPEAPPPPPPPFTTAPPPPPQFSAPHSPPPPPRTPPPIFIAQPAPSSGKGWFWKVFAILMFLGLGATLLVIFNLFTGSAGSSNRSVHQKRQHLEEITLEENHSDDKIVIISIEGVISSQDQNRRGDNMVEDVRRQFKAARKDPDVRAVILKVNSPGGEVLASDEIFNMVDTFQQETGKPVIASMHTLAASGGYYVSAPCRWIVANELTITGSIGVIMQGLNFSGLMEKVGLQTETYKSGEHKDMLSPFRRKDEIPEEERKMVQGLITETYGKFTNIVETGRSEAFRANSKMKEKGQSLDESWANYADGRVLSGRQAYELGFVDELGDFRTAVDRAATIAKISKANLIEYQQPFDLGDLFSIFGQTESRAIKVDLGVDFPKLQPGCLYFLYRQAVP